MTDFPIFPDQASSIASSVDGVYFLLTGVSVFFAVVIFVTVFYFAIRFRRRSEDEIPAPMHGSMKLEIAWSVIPGIIALGIFAWGTTIYFRNADPPPDAMEIYVVGKQWMWKMQHPEGRREINELHLPVGQPVKLTMATEDVIHSFYVPAFRVKNDVVPGRYTSLWFEPTKVGEYHLFCAEYCGNQHSQMVGTVYVMDPVDYQAWLAGDTGASMSDTGQALFQRLGCASCHRSGGSLRGPALDNIYNSQVQLDNGQVVVADDSYLRESILDPLAKRVPGYNTDMPTFRGQLSEEQLLQIIAYIKSLSPGQEVTQ